MSEYLCDGCRQKMESKTVGTRRFMCPKCNKTLCERCKGSGRFCKDSAKGTAGCSGEWRQIQ